ncbi:hypothetical protein WN51_12306 [Melipona quadrifasciata]|uniref:Uncharacterized protein n=1 Tax=Melipona quadrifasciata TaxID=166423 RepID=A0A0N0BL00_9HYME|nr:hypothetical protein WN51_12306 [Melipona quadrifasciata]
MDEQRIEAVTDPIYSCIILHTISLLVLDLVNLESFDLISLESFVSTLLGLLFDSFNLQKFRTDTVSQSLSLHCSQKETILLPVTSEEDSILCSWVIHVTRTPEKGKEREREMRMKDA